MAASGLHQDPYVPDIKDLAAYNKMWPTKVAHSKQFRRPEDFKDKVTIDMFTNKTEWVAEIK